MNIKNHIKLLLFTLVLATRIQAQYIDLQTGFSFATGNFSNTSKPQDSYATNGNTSGISVNYLCYKKLGICAKLNYSVFGVDINELSAQSTKTASAGTIVNVTSQNNFRASSVLVGPYLSFGKNNFTIDLRFLLGFLSLKTPQLFYNTTYKGSTYTQTTASEQDAAFAIGYGVTAKYLLPKNIYLCFHIDYINANTTFTKNGYQSSNKETITRPFQANLITLGLGYALK